MTSKPSPSPSTTAPARPSVGRPLPRSSKNNYARYDNPVLQRPIELAQFRSKKVVRLLRNNDLLGSMGRVGACGDNAAMESFFSLLQKNVLDTQRWETREELRLAIVVWIETNYNRRRRQRALGRLTPAEFEMIYTTAEAA